MKQINVAAFLVLALSSLALAQQESPTANPDLTVDQVVAMVHSGLSDNVIVAVLHKANKSFNLSAEDLIRLKKENISDAMLQTMLDPQYAPPQTQAVTVTSAISPVVNPSGATIPIGSAMPGDSDNPLTQHDSGIYVFSDGKMTALERAAYQRFKVSGFLASFVTLGLAPSRFKAELAGAHADIQVAEGDPVFYFYFDDKAAGLGKTEFDPLSSPNQFVLVKLNVGKNKREVNLGSISTIGASLGTDAKSQVAFKTERVRAGLYKVSLAQPIGQGEYCFLASGPRSGSGPGFGPGPDGDPDDASRGFPANGATTDIFDFGVALKRLRAGP